MSDLISIKEYADLHGLSIETVKTRVKHHQIPVIRFGKSVLIDRHTPWEARKKTGRPTKEAAELRKIEKLVKGKALKIKITRAYYVAVEDATGKEVASDFTFLTKAEAEKLGERMRKEVEKRYE